jgi:hypothetical protein
MNPARTAVNCSAVFLFAMALSDPAAAQTPPEAPPDTAMPPPPPPPPPPPAPPPEAPPPAPMAIAAPPGPPAGPASGYVLSPPPQSPFKIETPNGSSIRFGLLLQPQFQSVSSATLNGYSNDIYLRRTRVLIGGTLLGAFEYFFDTDFANLFFTEPPMAGMPDPGTKATPGMNIQDAFGTWKAYGDMIKVDVGYMLPPLAHNAVQGATTLYSWDYFAYTFLSGVAAPFNASASPVGRDTGAQLRGLLAGGRVEYRAGLFQGRREAATATDVVARNFFRFTTRVQVNLLDPETGFFYAGTYHGAKKILSLGGSLDLQDSYRYFAGDAFVDLPLGRNVLTAQINYAYWNPNGGIVTLPARESALMGEAGFLIGAAELSPIIRAEHLWVTNANDTTRLGGGLAWWPYGHNSNLKAFYTNAKTENEARSVNQFNVQWQLYFY